jgi:hypothetical protein
VKGHLQILDLRAQGFRPAAVFVHVGGEGDRRYADRDIADGALPEVWTGDDDARLTDLRFLRGLRVHLDAWACGPEWFDSWWDEVLASGPSEVYGVDADGRVKTWRK